jgi:MOSC domain-containing protein YiiM
MTPCVEKIFVTPQGGEDMAAVSEVDAVEGCGLRGDRYCEGTGYWTEYDECHVTLIEAEDLEDLANETGLRVLNGEHRRNLVTRGVRLDELAGSRFRIGGALLEYDRPRPPCSYIQSITQSGMTEGLAGRSGICARVIESGIIRVNDPIEIIS